MNTLEPLPLEPRPLHDTEHDLPAPLVLTAAPSIMRALAALVDLAFVLALCALATWLIVVSDPDPPPVRPWNVLDQVVDYLHDRPGRAALSAFAGASLAVLWQLVFLGRTPGRRLLRLNLVDATGRPPRPGRLLAWSVLRLLTCLPAGLGALWAILDPERRTLYDRLAGVWVERPSRADTTSA